MSDETAIPVVGMLRPRWGDPARTAELPGAAAALAGDREAAAGVDPDTISPALSTVDAAVREDISAVVGADNVSDADAARVQHTRGYSTPDILRLRAGDADDAPDLVVYPGDHDEVVAILRVCSERRIAVVPFTGGTSVVGGLTPDRAGLAGVISLDLRRLDRVVEIDEISRTATLQAGLRGPAAEALLREKGWTIGHFPQSYEGAGIGGYAATRSAGQSSAGYGRFDEMVEGLVLATPRGTIELGTAPRSAAGPDLRQLVLGSEGVFGVITSVQIRIRPAPTTRVFDAWRFASFAEGVTALRRLAQDGPLPTVLRLSDEVETALNLADPAGAGSEASGPDDAGAGSGEGDGDGDGGGCLVVAGYEGAADEVARRRDAASSVLIDAGGGALGEGPGEAWRTGRFAGPYLRDPLLDAGVLVETLETVAFWSRLHDVRAAVTAALTDSLTASGTPPLIMCHVSHVYASGASLYFTVVAPFADDPLAQWGAAKVAANSAIRASGASITHHHAVGRDHRDAYHDEIGPLALDALRSVKASLDPDGVCNPGILL
ncbi:MULTISPECIES: FAD-binding oxidoreductase [unclassified Gordonia (in: high G+C Gram-positive bacteria)]|uniref:FAD-binding oxidoreductase n=1 Tax=unclassified Gordonia (in: high G+C Gram-positive bacteria) TaxID=2657482 RepID=UPI0009911B67|nr:MULTISPECIES: FAD-binding oxidoreductase [unclassified Gordonia (in: high G+C Gram-positive bacteria)]MCX2756391.1 FAD-binding oxidoreductase [Gordonia sp. 4N]